MCGQTIENYVKFKQKCLESEEQWKSFQEDCMVKLLTVFHNTVLVQERSCNLVKQVKVILLI